MKFLFIFFIFCSCSATHNLRGSLSSQGFKDRALCQCIASGLDSSRKNHSIQKIVPYDPVSVVLFDTTIFENLRPVLKELYIDSMHRVESKSEAAQGKPVFYFCMRYYKSVELNNLARKELKKARKINNLEEYISMRYPTF